MTLVVALANRSVAAVVADRRVSQERQIVQNEYNKLTVLCCKDARMAVAFSGLALHCGFNASDWLADSLASRQPIAIHEVLEALRVRAAQRFSELPPEADRRMTIVFCGFVYWTAPRPVVYVLSNHLHGGEVPNNFALRTVPLQEDGSIVEIIGDDQHLEAGANAALSKMMARNPDPARLIHAAVKRIRNAAQAGSWANTIGEQCNAAVIPAAINSVITTTYHTARDSPKAFGANVVFAPGMSLKAVEMFSSGAALAGPDLHRNSPCWCASGKSFKNCHLKKYGAFYATAPGWKAPLPFIAQTRPENLDCLTPEQRDRTSGLTWVVSSGYQ